MIRASMILPTYNKVRTVEKALRSALAQTVDEIEVVVFDAGSTDGTYEKCIDITTNYTGAKTVKVMTCPENDYRGMNAGINLDFNWLHPQLQGDVVLFCGGDDWSEPRHVEYVLDIWDRLHPSWISTRKNVADADGNIIGSAPGLPDQCSRWISPAEAIRYQVGSSGSLCWARDLYEKYFPIRGIESNDIILPVMSLFERGMYYIDIPLHTYGAIGDLDNLGLEGQMRGCKTDLEKAQVLEINNYHNCSNWFAVLRRIMENGHDKKMSQDAMNALNEKLQISGNGWAMARDDLTLKRIAPKGFGYRHVKMEGL